MRRTVLVLLALSLLAAAVPARSTPPPAHVTCSFSNPNFSGWCRASADVPEGKTGRDACVSILDCLNDSQCSKSYCNSTEVRTGWKLEKVEPPDGKS